MKNIQLSLIECWYVMTKQKIKLEDYRDITPYWCNRLLLYNGASFPKNWWQVHLFDNKSISEIVDIIINKTTFKPFTQNTITLGYPKSTDSERILKLEHKGIEIRTGNPEWGAEEGKLYFVIKHGKIIT